MTVEVANEFGYWACALVVLWWACKGLFTAIAGNDGDEREPL